MSHHIRGTLYEDEKLVIDEMKKGEVLVACMTQPEFIPAMKKAIAIITDEGGLTCHAAIISRELGIPCVVGTNDGTEKIKDGQRITVSCAEGESGNIYSGLLKFKINEVDLGKIPKTKNQIRFR